jgi:multiple antibiotic resistance protein
MFGIAPWHSATASFLLAFPAFFSIVNPVGGGLIYSQITGYLTHDERVWLARRIAIYSSIVMIVSLGGGAYLLNFFGISLAALRIAGGLVVAVRAWYLLSEPETHEDRKQEQAGEASGSPADMSFYPLTMPFTTGPGTISVAIALGANRPASGIGLIPFFLGASGAVLAIAILIWIAYRWSDWLMGLLGPSGGRIVTRLSAFLLLCIGTQILLNGVDDQLSSLFDLHH